MSGTNFVLPVGNARQTGPQQNDASISGSAASQSATSSVYQSLNGPGPTLYYGAAALGIFSLVLISVGIRWLIVRKRTARITRERLATERADLERRGEGSGLPTYTQSRGQAAGLPLYTIDYQSPPTSPQNIGTPTEQHSHFHFHLPNLPAALHLRHTLANDMTYPPAPPAYVPNKFETDTPITEAAPAIMASSSNAEMNDMTQTNTASASARAVEEATYEEEFIHPEELRRREAFEADTTHEFRAREDTSSQPARSNASRSEYRGVGTTDTGVHSGAGCGM